MPHRSRGLRRSHRAIPLLRLAKNFSSYFSFLQITKVGIDPAGLAGWGSDLKPSIGNPAYGKGRVMIQPAHHAARDIWTPAKVKHGGSDRTIGCSGGRGNRLAGKNGIGDRHSGRIHTRGGSDIGCTGVR